MDSLYLLLIVLVCLFLEGLFSGGELALISVDVNWVRHLAKKKNLSAILTLSFLERPDRFLATTLAGTNLCVISATAAGTAFFITNFGAGRGELLAACTMVPLLLVFGEIIPKSLFQQQAPKAALRICWLIFLASYLLFPLVFLISLISRGTIGMAGKEKELCASHITKSGLRHLLKSQGGATDILAHEREMVQRILDFSELTVGKVMVSLSTMTALPTTAGFAQAAALFAQKKYLRVPVYQDQIFNVIGIVQYHDLMRHSDEQDQENNSEATVGSICRKNVLFVPENKLAQELLLEMRERHEQMAIVVDEYGGAVGMVTREDILAEIVGKFEHHDNAGFRRIALGRYLVSAKISREKINQLLPDPLPAGDYETLAGFLLAKMGKIPRRKEMYQQGRQRFIIEDADARTIREVLVVFPPELDKNTRG